jgi:hypothetical protein
VLGCGGRVGALWDRVASPSRRPVAKKDVHKVGHVSSLFRAHNGSRERAKGVCNKFCVKNGETGADTFKMLRTALSDD